MLFALKDRLF